MFIRPECHASEYQHGRAPAGRSVAGPVVLVEQQDDGYITLLLEPLPGEAFDDRDVVRNLTSSEARELAAMLRHHAEENDRRSGLR